MRSQPNVNAYACPPIGEPDLEGAIDDRIAGSIDTTAAGRRRPGPWHRHPRHDCWRGAADCDREPHRFRLRAGPRTRWDPVVKMVDDVAVRRVSRASSRADRPVTAETPVVAAARAPCKRAIGREWRHRKAMLRPLSRCVSGDHLGQIWRRRLRRPHGDKVAGTVPPPSASSVWMIARSHSRLAEMVVAIRPRLS